MRRAIFTLVVVLAVFGTARAQGTDAKAEKILKQARAVIADESKFKSLVGLQANGTVRQTFGERQMESELEIEIMAPDKIRKNTISSFATITSVLNGDQMWNDFVPAVGMGGGMGGGMRVMMGGGGPGGAASPMASYMQLQQKRELLQVLLGWFLTPPPSSQMQFAFVGEAPGPEGTRLDVIDGKSADGLAIRLYFTQDEHRLLGLSYKAKQARRGFGGGGGGGGGGRPQGQPGQGGGQPGQGGPPPAGQQGQAGQPGQQGQRPQMTPEERERRTREAMEAFEKSPEVDYRWVFEDYKGVGGFNLPHRLTKIEAGTPTEEWTFAKIKLNAKMTADKFVKKEKEKQP